MSTRNKLTVIDLFAGCGGLSLGLEQAGFVPIYVNELNDDARETYLVNRKEHPKLRKKFWSDDIRKVVEGRGVLRGLVRDLCYEYDLRGKYPIDLVVGGPPCQGFSSVGIRRSYKVDKHHVPSNHLYKYMAKFISNVRPKAFLFENVEGLLRARWSKDGESGEIFKDVLKTFRGLAEYNVKHKLVYSKDYGVPQNRPRVFIVGFRKDVVRGVPEGDDAIEGGFLPAGKARAPNLDQVLGDLADPSFAYGGKSTAYYRAQPTNPFQKRMRTDTRKKPLRERIRLKEQEYSNHSVRTRRKFKEMIADQGRIPLEFQTKKFRQRVLLKKWGEAGPTITITSLPDDFVHYSLPRSLTVRECARIQTFPDWYEFRGPRTTGGLRRAGNPVEGKHHRDLPKYTQIANAVPPDLARAVGSHLAKILRRARKGRGH